MEQPQTGGSTKFINKWYHIIIGGCIGIASFIFGSESRESSYFMGMSAGLYLVFVFLELFKETSHKLKLSFTVTYALLGAYFIFIDQIDSLVPEPFILSLGVMMLSFLLIIVVWNFAADGIGNVAVIAFFILAALFMTIATFAPDKSVEDFMDPSFFIMVGTVYLMWKGIAAYQYISTPSAPGYKRFLNGVISWSGLLTLLYIVLSIMLIVYNFFSELNEKENTIPKEWSLALQSVCSLYLIFYMYNQFKLRQYDIPISNDPNVIFTHALNLISDALKVNDQLVKQALISDMSLEIDDFGMPLEHCPPCDKEQAERGNLVNGVYDNEVWKKMGITQEEFEAIKAYPEGRAEINAYRKDIIEKRNKEEPNESKRIIKQLHEKRRPHQTKNSWLWDKLFTPPQSNNSSQDYGGGPVAGAQGEVPFTTTNGPGGNFSAALVGSGGRPTNANRTTTATAATALGTRSDQRSATTAATAAGTGGDPISANGTTATDIDQGISPETPERPSPRPMSRSSSRVSTPGPRSLGIVAVDQGPDPSQGSSSRDDNLHSENSADNAPPPGPVQQKGSPPPISPASPASPSTGYGVVPGSP